MRSASRRRRGAGRRHARGMPAAAAGALTLLLAASLGLLPSAVTPATATQSIAGAQTTLVLRSACDAGDPSVFEPQRLVKHASEVGRPTPREFHVLGFNETCGPSWPASVSLGVLSALTSGGDAAAVGWPGAPACGAVVAASSALKRPRAAPCARPAARAAAVTALALRLHWRRASLPPDDDTGADGGECGVTLQRAALALAAAGLAVTRASLYADELNHPDVVILCACSRDWPAAARASVRAVLLLAPAHPTSNIKALAPTATDNNSTISPLGSNEVNKERSKVNATVDKVNDGSDKNISSVKLSKDRSKVNASGDKATIANEKKDSANVNKDRSRVNATIDNFTARNDKKMLHTATNNVTIDEYDNSDEYLIPLKFSLNSPPILLLTDAPINRNKLPTVEDIYQEALEALQSNEDTIRTGKETHQARFHLYENSHGTWNHITELQTVLTRNLTDEEYKRSITVKNATVDFDAWCLLRARGEDLAWTGVMAGLVGVAVLLLMLAVVGAGRAVSRRRRGRRRRRDAVLHAADFTFPPDERRLAPGMESMLSCWLQQLHEFGGPELEQPDLLKQPPPPSASSTNSVNRLADTRVKYKGEAVHLKCLPSPPALELRRKATDALLLMQGLRHENLNPFIGCLCSPRPALVFDHCGRGSLEDVLVADDIKLDWTFRLSLLTDLARGLRALHASPLRAHGRLSSRNCVVDARWVLRITDCGVGEFRRAQGLPPPHRTARELLWTAPELLRELAAERHGGKRGGGGGGGGGGEPRATPAGDVFAFGVIMQEVIVRGEPYCMLPLTPDEIIEKLCRPPPLCRPSVPLSAAPPEAVGLMRQCWAEAPELRPTADRIDQVFRHLHKGRKMNIVDSMFEMLEKYSNNLEELIRERTAQLDTEKRKTEQLLNRMLPKSVAERLVLGGRVEPEVFEEVSIYFSDIVGFTGIAARSSPVQVVALLNDLYTTFDAAIEQYEVYKVETIGDAYMVVGGLPVRCRTHAQAVATMALHLLHLAGRFTVRHLPREPLLLRIGLHSGACCAGVVGLTMPRYCLFGDTVNTASRMESTGAAWRIQVSAATAALLSAAGGYRLRSRGLTQVKGKGAMHTYWLLGKDGFDKPLPAPPPLESEEVLHEHESERGGGDAPEFTAAEAQLTPSADAVQSAQSPGERARGWQRSGAASADSSPPAAPRAVVTGDRSAAYARYRCLSGGGARALRRQWSLERGEALASLPPPPPRYRTRPDN